MPPGESVDVLVERLTGRLNTQDETLKEISDDIKATRRQAELTNGRVKQLELDNAKAEGARKERALIIEETRKRRAINIARHEWIRTSIGGGIAGLAVAAASQLLHLI